MARPRSDTATLTREGHSISLKVLRLSRPSLAQQHPLPHNNTAGIQHGASLSFPSTTSDQDFILSTNLSLPPAFGSAYVGETFACSLCANNELSETSNEKTVSGVRITAEMQTPSQTVAVPISTPQDQQSDSGQLGLGTSMQRIIRFDLKEEGNHVLAVNVTYTETTSGVGGSSPIGGRIRTFRKLYQFLAQPCLSVRTKATELTPAEVQGKSQNLYDRTLLLRYVLEAQLENVSESRIVLEEATLKPVPPFKSTSLNWDIQNNDRTKDDAAALNPRDIVQIAFSVEQEQDATTGLEELKANLKRDGRTILGQISIQWRGAMGERGHLSTGNLLTRKSVAA